MPLVESQLLYIFLLQGWGWSAIQWNIVSFLLLQFNCSWLTKSKLEFWFQLLVHCYSCTMRTLYVGLNIQISSSMNWIHMKTESALVWCPIEAQNKMPVPECACVVKWKWRDLLQLGDFCMHGLSCAHKDCVLNRLHFAMGLCSIMIFRDNIHIEQSLQYRAAYDSTTDMQVWVLKLIWQWFVGLDMHSYVLQF